MERHVATILGGLALLVGLWNGWSLKGIGARLEALEQLRSAPPIAAVAPVPAPAVAAPPQARPPNNERIEVLRNVAERADLELTRENLQDPEFREELASVVKAEGQRHLAERQETLRTSLTDEIEAFGAAQGLSPSTIGRLLGELERRSDVFLSVRQDLAAGDLSRVEALRELQELQAESDDRLHDLLGEEGFAQLSERIWSDRPGRKR